MFIDISQPEVNLPIPTMMDSLEKTDRACAHVFMEKTTLPCFPFGPIIEPGTQRRSLG